MTANDERITPYSMRLPTTKARERLAEIVGRVQDPRFFCVLTRHGRPVAAIVSMSGLKRIHRQEDHERVYDGSWAPGGFYTARDGKLLTMEQAGEEVQQVQLDRLGERLILEKSGLKPVPGGEVTMEISAAALAEEAPVRRKRRWWRFWG